MKKLFFVTFLLAFGLMSCKKNKDKSCTVSEQTLVGSYKVTSVKYQASASVPAVESINDFLEPCELDDVITFLSNHSYTYKDAGTQCSPNGDDDGSWSLSGNVLNVDGDNVTFDSFSCTGFTLSISNYDVDGDKATITYKKQ
ncbi:MAG: lipocalin family protein [Ginsengibacter sp.]